MYRGGTGLHRRLAPLAVACSLWIAVVPASATANAASGEALRHVGESGSGPAPFPIELPAKVSSRASTFRWSDVDASDAWARQAIDFVGKTNDWMRDFAEQADGSVPFRPDRLESRRYLARAIVKAFAPEAQVDPSIAFTDLDPSQAFYRWANIAVQRGWMDASPDGRFKPDAAVTTASLHAILVDVLGLRPIARQLDALQTRGGVRFPTPRHFGALMLGLRLGLRFNNSDESMDVGPRTPLTRAQVAYSLFKASTLPSWVVPWVRDQYDGIVLPNMDDARTAIVRWGLRYVGYPYVWGGEWGIDSSQPVPGFDCSGIVWWAMRRNDGASWRVHPPRPYEGWALPQRTSADMARFGRLGYDALRPGDLMFYDGNDDGTVDHVDVYLGNGYALDSSSSPGGVTIMWVGSGWYRDHFVHGRRILPSS